MSELQVNLQVRSSSTEFNTDGRTDARTKRLVADVDHLSVCNARTDDDRMASLAEIINAGVLRTGQRHERIRTGPREPLPGFVRSAVWYRDRGRCDLCTNRDRVGAGWECDHITPWSAGGSDDTTNLRVLCGPHNQQRSNYVDPFERPRRPATWWCVRCYSRAWETTPEGFPICPWHVSEYWRINDAPIDFSYKRCRVMAAHMREFEEDGEVTGWHKRPRVEGVFVVAHCAHCGIPSLTDKPL